MHYLKIYSGLLLERPMDDGRFMPLTFGEYYSMKGTENE